MAVYAIDAGGTRIKLGLVENGTVLARGSLEARADEGLAPQLPRIAAALRSLSPLGERRVHRGMRSGAHQVERGEGSQISGVGMAFPSLIDGDRVVGHVGKYRDAEGLDLARWASDEFRASFAVENDARMATVGEWRHGAGRGATDLVMVTLGTGIGTGVVSEGRVLRGRHGTAGVLGGHMTAQVGGRPCPCGNAGCWETLASTAFLQGFDGYEAVFASDSPEASAQRAQSMEVWGALAVSLVHAYDPEVLVFGGGVMAAGETVLGPIREAIRRHAWAPWGSPRVVASELGDDAALVACEWLLESRR